MSAFDPPAGDAGAVKQAGAMFSTVGVDLGTDESGTRAAVAEAVRTWTGNRFISFMSASPGVQYQLHTAAGGCHEAAVVLDRYAKALDTATTEVANAAYLAGQAHSAAEHGPGGKPDARLHAQLSGTVAKYEQQAEAAKRTLHTAALNAAAAIDALTGKVAPASSSLSPAQIRRQVTGEFTMTGLTGNPNGDLTDAEAEKLLGAAQQAVPLDAMNPDGSVNYAKAAALPTLPAKHSSPKDIKTWRDTLSPMEQNALLNSKYAELGKLDGMPVADRDFANRKNMPHIRAHLEGEIAALGPAPKVGKPMGREPAPGVAALQQWQAKYAAIMDKIGGIDHIAKILGSNNPAPHYLIGLSGSDNGQAIVATGNPDTAATSPPTSPVWGRNSVALRVEPTAVI